MTGPEPQISLKVSRQKTLCYRRHGAGGGVGDEKRLSVSCYDTPGTSKTLVGYDLDEFTVRV